MTLESTTILSGILLLFVFGLVGWRARIKRGRGESAGKRSAPHSSRD